MKQTVRVINGNGKGGKIGEISNLKIPQYSIRSEMDCFLDAVTGDLYTLRHESQEWIPFCNIGLHNVRLAQEFNTLGKYVIQVPVYRPKKNVDDKLQVDCFFEDYEVKCYLKKAHSNHWLFAECGLEFVVPHKSKWQVHGFKFLDEEKQFEAIAESDDGAFIIEYPNIIGVKFEIDSKYPETCVILQNYLTKCAREILERGGTQGKSIQDENPVSFSRVKRFVFNRKPSESQFQSPGDTPSRGMSVTPGPQFRNKSMGQLKEIRKIEQEAQNYGYTVKKKGIPINKKNFIAEKPKEGKTL